MAVKTALGISEKCNLVCLFQVLCWHWGCMGGEEGKKMMSCYLPGGWVVGLGYLHTQPTTMQWQGLSRRCMKCFGNAKERVISSAWPGCFPLVHAWTLEVEGNFIREFGESMPSRGRNVNKGTQVWHINMLISSQPQIPLVTKSRA